ncbi:hypothetical protein D3C73_1381870 [compost metagenome]
MLSVSLQKPPGKAHCPSYGHCFRLINSTCSSRMGKTFFGVFLSVAVMVKMTISLGAPSGVRYFSGV